MGQGQIGAMHYTIQHPLIVQPYGIATWAVTQHRIPIFVTIATSGLTPEDL